MQDTQLQSLDWEDPLEKEMATHSSVLAWRVPWTEEWGRWQSMGLQGAGQDRTTFTFPFGGSNGKESAHNTADLGSIPGLGRSPGEGHGNPLQYSCLGNPMDTGVWRAPVHGITKSQTQLSTSGESKGFSVPGLV